MDKMTNLLLKLISFYQRIFSPDHGIFSTHLYGGCRFYPSCSYYSKEAILKFGLAKSLPRIFWRILRCSPLSKGGIDEVS